MTYTGGSWGEKAKKRSKDRLEYFKIYSRRRRGTKDLNSYNKRNKSMAYRSEMLGLKLLHGSNRIYRPTDLDWKGKKVDVKSGIKHRGSTGSGISDTYRWKFYLKQKDLADYFLFICNDEEGKVEHVFLIPNSDLNSKNFSLSENSIPQKYSKYELTII